ncbi:MAG TPA: hypothetical protein VFB38_02075 [Chthonomonadaceae bacterium]|nr:hypothetical protein [Chthonomonadaceae bacterium]
MRRNHAKLFWLGLIGLLLALLIARMRHVATVMDEQARPYGRLTAEEIRERALALYHTIVPRADAVRIAVDRPASGSPLPCWTAECTDAQGAFPIDFQWEAATGLCAPSDAPAGRPRMRRAAV